MAKGSILTGFLVLLIGIWLFFLVIRDAGAPIWVLIYPIITIGIGVAIILLNKEEDKIERRKDIK